MGYCKIYKKSGVVSETPIVTAIQQLLQIYEDLGKILFIRNNSGAMKTAEGRFIRFGKTGSPDFLLFMQNKTVHLEVKAEDGKLSAGQKDYRDKIMKLGHDYLVVRSVEDVERLLN
jgi:hypothetical protein